MQLEAPPQLLARDTQRDDGATEHREGEDNARRERRAGGQPGDGGVAAGRALFSGTIKPDAVFCANDQIAFGLMDVVRQEARLRIPEDVAVIGFDDVPESSWLSYQLTTFRQDPLTMALRAVELMERRLENPDAPAGYERVIPELVIRQSFRP